MKALHPLREQAIMWWKNIHREDKKMLMEKHQCLGFLYRTPNQLTGREIENIWRKENNIYHVHNSQQN